MQRRDYPPVPKAVLPLAPFPSTSPVSFDETLLPSNNWHEWKLGDTCTRLSVKSLRLWREYFWGQTGDESPAVFHYAQKRRENIVFFACTLVHRPDLFLVRDPFQRTLLHTVIGSGCSDSLVHAIITFNPVAADTFDSMGDTPYHTAAAVGRPVAMSILCGKGDAQYIYRDGMSITMSLCTTTLPSLGIRERNCEGYTPVHVAIDGGTQGQRECIDVMCKTGMVTVNTRRGYDGLTPLHMCIDKGDVAGAQTLMNNGAYSLIRDGNGLSALQSCILKERGLGGLTGPILGMLVNDEHFPALSRNQISELDDILNSHTSGELGYFSHQRDSLLCGTRAEEEDSPY